MSTWNLQVWVKIVSCCKYTHWIIWSLEDVTGKSIQFLSNSLVSYKRNNVRTKSLAGLILAITVFMPINLVTGCHVRTMFETCSYCITRYLLWMRSHPLTSALFYYIIAKSMIFIQYPAQGKTKEIPIFIITWHETDLKS